MSKANPLLTNLPSEKSGSQTWIQFYNDLDDNLGEKRANRNWMIAWSDRGSSSASTEALRSMLKKKGVQIDSSVWNDVTDATIGVGSFVGGIVSGVKTMGYITFGVLAVGVLALVWGIATNISEVAGAVVSATPAGRVGKIAKLV